MVHQKTVFYTEQSVDETIGHLDKERVGAIRQHMLDYFFLVKIGEYIFLSHA